MYAAALTSAEATTNLEPAGLLAHMFNVVQLTKNSQGNQWLHYNRSFREWVAARDVRIWQELNLSIFDHCLATQQRATYQPREEARQNHSLYSKSAGCYLWNFEKTCNRWRCQFHHSCYYCGGPHKAPNCPLVLVSHRISHV